MGRRVMDHFDFAGGTKRVIFDENGDASHIVSISNDNPFMDFIGKYIAMPIILIIILYFGGSYLISLKMPSLLMPTYHRVMDEGLYRNGICYKYEEFAEQYMINNQIESWKQFGLVNDKKNSRGFQCSAIGIGRLNLKDYDLNSFDIWYKTNEFSIVQSIVCIETEFYNNGNKLKTTDNKDFSLKQYFLVRSKMIAKRDILSIEYIFEPEHIQLIYQDYDLEKLSNQL